MASTNFDSRDHHAARDPAEPLSGVDHGRQVSTARLLHGSRTPNSGPQTWKQYTAALLIFNTVLFVFGFIVLALQPWMPLNGQGKERADDHLPHRRVVHDEHRRAALLGRPALLELHPDLLRHRQLLPVGVDRFLRLTAIIRALRGDKTIGNFFVDMWRVVMYTFLPAAFVVSFISCSKAVPMTFESALPGRDARAGAMGTTDDGEAKQQTIVVGPLAVVHADEATRDQRRRLLRMNNAHPFESPTALTNFVSCVAMMLFPFALVLMYGRMLKRLRHAWVIFWVMMAMMVGTIVWTVYYDTLQPNPGLTAHAGHEATRFRTRRTGRQAHGGVAGGRRAAGRSALGQSRRQGAALRHFAGATWAALTVDVTDGSVNCEHDSLNPLAGLGPFVGMWLNCIYGGVGVGLINMLIFLIVGVFIAGLMVGRTPEYLGKKIEAREMKLAMVALLDASDHDPLTDRPVCGDGLGA